MYVNFCLRILTKSFAIPQQLYKPASHGLSATAELLVNSVHRRMILKTLALEQLAESGPFSVEGFVLGYGPVTRATFHSRLKTYLFHKSFP